MYNFKLHPEIALDYLIVIQNYFWVSSTLADMLIHFEQLRYLDFYTLSITLPHGVCKLTPT
jgi:hypothetical protein